MTVAANLEKLGYELPAAVPPVANYVPYLVAGDMLYISGQIPVKDGTLSCKGTVGADVSVEEAVEAARLCAINILGQVYAAVDGDWARVKRCIKLGGFVSCVAGFTDHSTVINGASDLLVSVLGDSGKHTRFAVGAASLPLGAAVEIEAVFQLNTGKQEE